MIILTDKHGIVEVRTSMKNRECNCCKSEMKRGEMYAHIILHDKISTNLCLSCIPETVWTRIYPKMQNTPQRYHFNNTILIHVDRAQRGKYSDDHSYKSCGARAQLLPAPELDPDAAEILAYC